MAKLNKYLPTLFNTMFYNTNQPLNFWQKFVFLMFLVIGIGSLSSFLSLVLGAPLFGIDWKEIENLSNNMDDTAVVQFYKFSQFFAVWGYMIIPSILFYSLRKIKPMYGLGMSNMPNWTAIFLAVVLMIGFLPFINAMAALNAELQLPQSLNNITNWMREAENENNQLITAFLNASNWSDYGFTFLIMAILPAFGEEMLFRGVLQPSIEQSLKNKHAAIWITAFVFSFIHFQFYGFLPRFILGAGLGYLYAYSGQLRLPIAAHFANNAFALISIKLIENDVIQVSPDEWGVGENLALELVISTALIGIFLFGLIKTGAFKSKVITE